MKCHWSGLELQIVFVQSLGTIIFSDFRFYFWLFVWWRFLRKKSIPIPGSKRRFPLLANYCKTQWLVCVRLFCYPKHIRISSRSVEIAWLMKTIRSSCDALFGNRICAEFDSSKSITKTTGFTIIYSVYIFQFLKLLIFARTNCMFWWCSFHLQDPNAQTL